MLWLAWLVAGAWIVFGYTRVVSDLTLFLPRASTPLEQLLVEQLRTGPASRAVLVALEGAPAPTLARLSKTLAQRLRESGLYSYVNNGEVPWLSHERDLLLNNRYLLSPQVTPERFTTEALRESLQQRLQALASPIGLMDKELLPRDPTGEFVRVLTAWVGQYSPASRHGAWFTADGKRALLLVETRASAFDPAAQVEAQARIRKEFASAAASEHARLVLSGPAVFALEARNSIRHEVWLLSGLASAFVVLFLLGVYRSVRVLLLIAVPVLTGLLTGVAAVVLVFGAIHAITLAFGATLIGVAVDYPIHLFSHRLAGESPAQVIQRIWPTLRLGALTSALGYSAMLFSGFSGLSQLGLFAIVGVLAAAAVTRWVLPVLVARTVSKPAASTLSVAAAVDQLRRLRWLPAAMTAAALIYLAALNHSPWETDIANLSPVSAESKAIDRELRAALGAADVHTSLVVFGDNAEQALQKAERLTPVLENFVEQKIIAGFDVPSRYLPSIAVQRQRQAALPAESTLRATLKLATQGLPFRKGLFEPFVADVVATRANRALQPADFRDTSLGLRLESLLFPHAAQWAALLPLRGISDATALASWVAHLNDPDVHYLDLKASSNRLVNRYRDEALTLLAWGAAGIVLVLTLGLHSRGAVLRVLIPVGAAVISVAALLLALGEQLSLFHIVALLLVVGVGLDYGLFFNRAFGDPAERERTARALLVCNTTTVLVFGVLAFSETPVLNAIGTTTAAGAIMSLLFAAALSPPPVADRPRDTAARPVR